MFKELRLLFAVSSEEPKKSDAIVCLEGDDDFIRADKSLELFKKNLSPVIVVLGRQEVADYLIGCGLPQDNIIFIQGDRDPKKRNTYTEATNVLEKAIQNKWGSIILVTSQFHQPRAFLTFLKAAKNLGFLDKVRIYNAPVRHSWLKKMKSTPVNRLNLLLGFTEKGEFKKIKEYHLTSVEEAIEYQQWKEKQP